MKHSSRKFLLAGAALIAAPAIAQDAPTPQQSVTPPPLVVAPAPAPQPAPVQVAPAAPVVQPIPSVEQQMAGSPNQAESRADAAPARRAASPAAAPARPRQVARAAAPAVPAVAAAPAPAPGSAPAPAPQAAAPAPAPAAPQAAPEQPAPQAALAPAPRQAPSSNWIWLAAGLLLVIGGAVALMSMMRRRRRDDAVAEDTYVEARSEPFREATPEPVAARMVEPEPAPEFTGFAVAPVAAAERVDESVEAHVEAQAVEPEPEELAGVADAPAPVSNRPWLEFGLRPVRAGTSEEEALVDVELTVGNAGDVPARDVHIATFMLADSEGSEMERLLTARHADDTVPPVSIAPGDGTRIDAHLAVPKGELGRTFNPVVVAEARYTLPDGSEGRTAAAFRIGRPSPDAEGVGPIGATRPHMVDNVEAELLGTPEHA